MIRKLIRQMLTAQIFSALTVSLCLLIDNIMIGRFLGEECVAAYGLANPILLICGAVGSMLAAGVQVVCSRSLGRGSQKETNEGYSTAIVMTLGISVFLLLAVLLFSGPLASLMGARSAGALHDETQGYLIGFVIGAPASMGALILVPFMQMAGQTGLLIVAVLGMTVADVVLDLMNVLVFNGGMFGMGLASSISYYIALAVGVVYFLSKKSVFRFSPRSFSLKKVRELLASGVPTVFNMASSVILIFSLNKLLLMLDLTSQAVTALTVVTTIGNASNCITTGIGGVSLTLSGIFYNEEDRTGLRVLIGYLFRASAVLGAIVGVLLLIFSPYAVGLFLPNEGTARALAILGVRLFALGLIPCCVNNALKNAYQATGRVYLTEIMSLVEGAFLPVTAAYLMSLFMGVKGVLLYFSLGEMLTVAALIVYIRLKTNRDPLKNSAYLLLRPDFGVREDMLMEKNILSLKDVANTAGEAGDFCRARGIDERLSNRISVCVEEMASNTVRYGFAQDGRNHLSVRVLIKNDRLILRFRDDCSAFDPVKYIPEKGHDALGIHLTLSMADEIYYTYSMNLNNLTVVINRQSGQETLNT